MTSTDARRRVPWPILRHVPLGAAIALSAAVAVAFVWPALREANWFDERSADLERGLRRAAWIDTAIEELSARRDAAQAELDSARIPLPAEVASRLVRDADGALTLNMDASFEEVAAVLAAIDRASGLSWVEVGVARGGSDQVVRLAVRLATVAAEADASPSDAASVEPSSEVQP